MTEIVTGEVVGGVNPPTGQGETIPPASVAEVVTPAARRAVDEILDNLERSHNLLMQANYRLLNQIQELDKALVMQNANHQHAFDKLAAKIEALSKPIPASPPDAVGGHRVGGKE